MHLQLTPPPKTVASIALPSSKSISNRALMISALCGGVPQVLHPALCDDTEVMIDALSQSQGGYINVGAAGTAMRFLTAYYATRDGVTVTLDGTERMRQRPIGPLVDALRQLGARITYLDREGFPPLQITGAALQGKTVVMDGGVSSQFVSAVMVILPAIGGGAIRLTGDIVSLPYILMTAAVMRDMGAVVEITDNLITIGKGYTGHDLMVEADWSAAAPWYALAALLPQSQLTLEGLTPNSIQGDARLVELGRKLGIASHFNANGVTLDTSQFIGCCCSDFADMIATPDLVPSWVVLLCLLERSFRITGVRTLQNKESNRTEALREELMKLGYLLKIESEDALSWYGERTSVDQHPPVINPHGDHRLAMSLAPAAARFPGLIIQDAEVVTKSYPGFWRHLEKCGFIITPVEQ